MENERGDMTFNGVEYPSAPEEWPGSPSEGLETVATEKVDLGKKAGFWIRSVAFFIDNIILNLVYVVFFVAGGLAVYLASGIEGWLMAFDRVLILTIPYNIIMLGITVGYFTYLHGSTGQTVGKMICRLKVVREDGEQLSYGKSFVRWVGYLLSGIVLNIGFLWAAFDKNKQGWHDKIARTYVVKLSSENA